MAKFDNKVTLSANSLNLNGYEITSDGTNIYLSGTSFGVDDFLSASTTITDLGGYTATEIDNNFLPIKEFKAAGNHKEIQINSGGSFAATDLFTYDFDNKSFTLGNRTGQIGQYSFVIGGYNGQKASNIASNFSSYAEGFGTISSGLCSHAEGRYTVAQGDYSHAGGNGSSTVATVKATNLASFNHSTVSSTNASGATGRYSSILGGRDNSAIGDGSSVIGGIGLIARGRYSFATGSLTLAQGDSSFSQGNSTVALGNYSHAEGDNTTANTAAHSEGRYTFAQGDYSHTGGNGEALYPIISSGIASFNHSYREEETFNVSGATGNYSTILGGVNNSATDDGSSVIGGNNCIASGLYSFATGIRTIASGSFSHTNGRVTLASGTAAYSSGYGNNDKENYFYVTASGLASFNHSYRNNAQGTFGATGDYSAILGGRDNSATSDGSSVIGGFECTSSGNYSFATGVYTKSLGYTSYSGGLGWDLDNCIISSGISSFNHSYRTSSPNVSGVTADYSAILGGTDHSVTSTNSAIIGGINNLVQHDRSVIIGGNSNVIQHGDCAIIGSVGITTDRKNCVYANKYYATDYVSATTMYSVDLEVYNNLSVTGQTYLSTVEFTEKSDTTIIMKDVDTGVRYKLYISGGTLQVQTA